MASAIKQRPRNLRFGINMLRAKAGLGTNMAVPRRAAQKQKQKLRRRDPNGAARPADAGGRRALREQLSELQGLQAQRRLFHLSKQLQVCFTHGSCLHNPALNG
jgi:hypothetical protein